MPINRFQEAIVWSSGKFSVDNEGRVWRGNKRAENKVGEYLQVKVMIERKRYYTCAHRLVWHALKGPIEYGKIINHKNGKKDDNRPDNLEVVTYSGNLVHAHAIGLVDQYGQKNPAAKLSDYQVAQIRNLYAGGGYTMEQIAGMFGVSFQHVSSLIRGHRRSKQLGPITNSDLRHSVSERDSQTGRFVKSIRLIEKVLHDEFPVVRKAAE